MVPISTGIACGLSLGNKILHEIVMKNYNNFKKLYEKDHQTIKSFDKILQKYLQDNLTDKSENESLCNIFLKICW